MKGVTLLANAVRWRWTPFVALVAAALFYVLLVVAVVPDRIGDGQPPRMSSPLTGSMLEGRAGTLAATQPRMMGGPEAPIPPPGAGPPPGAAAPPPPPASPDISRFGFSPPLPRAEPPLPAPEPPPPPVAAPLLVPPPPAEAPSPPVVTRSLAAPLQALPLQTAAPPPPGPEDDEEPPPGNPAQPPPPPAAGR